MLTQKFLTESALANVLTPMLTPVCTALQEGRSFELTIDPNDLPPKFQAGIVLDQAVKRLDELWINTENDTEGHVVYAEIATSLLAHTQDNLALTMVLLQKLTQSHLYGPDGSSLSHTPILPYYQTQLYDKLLNMTDSDAGFLDLVSAIRELNLRYPPELSINLAKRLSEILVANNKTQSQSAQLDSEQQIEVQHDIVYLLDSQNMQWPDGGDKSKVIIRHEQQIVRSLLNVVKSEVPTSYGFESLLVEYIPFVESADANDKAAYAQAMAQCISPAVAYPVDFLHRLKRESNNSEIFSTSIAQIITLILEHGETQDIEDSLGRLINADVIDNYFHRPVYKSFVKALIRVLGESAHLTPDRLLMTERLLALSPRLQDLLVITPEIIDTLLSPILKVVTPETFVKVTENRPAIAMHLLTRGKHPNPGDVSSLVTGNGVLRWEHAPGYRDPKPDASEQVIGDKNLSKFASAILRINQQQLTPYNDQSVTSWKVFILTSFIQQGLTLEDITNKEIVDRLSDTTINLMLENCSDMLRRPSQYRGDRYSLLHHLVMKKLDTAVEIYTGMFLQDDHSLVHEAQNLERLLWLTKQLELTLDASTQQNADKLRNYMLEHIDGANTYLSPDQTIVE